MDVSKISQISVDVTSKSFPSSSSCSQQNKNKSILNILFSFFSSKKNDEIFPEESQCTADACDNLSDILIDSQKKDKNTSEIRNQSVFIIDECSQSVAITKNFLLCSGYEVDHTNDILDVVLMIGLKQYDLIILDLQRRNDSYYDYKLIPEILATDRAPPIIVLSYANNLKSVVLREGASQFISKDLSHNIIYSKIKLFLWRLSRKNKI